MSAVSCRPATPEDAELASDVMTAAYPRLAQDPVITRYRWENPRIGYEYTRFLAYRDDRAVAFLASVHAPWDRLPDRHCEVEVWLDRGEQTADALASMLGWIEGKAVAQGAELLLSYCGEDEPVMRDVLRHMGYDHVRTERMWELDLQRNGPALVAGAEAARRRMQGQGLRLLTVAEWGDPDAVRKLFELNQRTVQDIPHTLTIVPERLEDFKKRMQAPDRRSDRWWVACDAERPVAISFLKFPPVRGPVFTGYTCSDPDYRGRGIARAVKLQSLAQAFELGIRSVFTDNDAENAPMLHINETLGYTPRPGFVEHHKRVEIHG